MQGIAAKALKEVTYHLRRSGEWVERLGDGTEESRQRMLSALPRVWRFTLELVNADAVEQRLFQAGIIANPEQVETLAEHSVSPERQVVLDALIRHRWKPLPTAQALGISRATLYRRVNRLGIDMPGKH